MTHSSVLVTGASKGIGEATALRLAGTGWRVFGGVRREECRAALRQAAGEAVVLVLLDATDAAQIEAAAATNRAATGGALQRVVNNAGMAVAGPLEFLPPEALRRQLGVNVI